MSVKPFSVVNSCGLFAISPRYEDSFDVWPAGPRFKGAIGLETDHDAIPGEKHRGEMLGKTWEKPGKNPGRIRFFVFSGFTILDLLLEVARFVSEKSNRI